MHFFYLCVSYGHGASAAYLGKKEIHDTCRVVVVYPL
jgi:hypothetical protein